jgi:3-dehydroquinate dehydratase-2
MAPIGTEKPASWTKHVCSGTICAHLGSDLQRRMANILVLHGPNLNLLGIREPGLYGSTTLADIDHRLAALAKEKKLRLQTLQSNAEHELIDRIHAARNDGVDFIIFNPAAFTHTSVALRDALLAVQIPFIEVHLSNVFARESFRHHSWFSDIAVGVISGLGAKGYELALLAAADRLAVKGAGKETGKK